MKLTQWVIENTEKWEIICRLSEKRFTANEAHEVLKEMKQLAESGIFRNDEFSAIFMVILYQYFDELFPGVPRD